MRLWLVLPLVADDLQTAPFVSTATETAEIKDFFRLQLQVMQEQMQALFRQQMQGMQEQLDKERQARDKDRQEMQEQRDKEMQALLRQQEMQEQRNKEMQEQRDKDRQEMQELQARLAQKESELAGLRNRMLVLV